MNYVIIGAGPAGVVAAETLRKLDQTATITLVGNEPEPPYSRMAIPYLLIDNIEEQGTYLRKQNGHFQEHRIDVVIGSVSSVDVQNGALKLSNGSEIGYDKLLVATGSRPISPPVPGIDHEKVTSCWTLADARKITNGVKPGASVVLIGAGFIGCIILESLVASGAELTVIEMGNRMVPRMLDERCGTMLERWCREKGVNVMTSSQVEAIESVGSNVNVMVSGGRQVEAELVISAAGVRPNADFLLDSGVELVNGAVLIDEYMQSSVPNVYAAGDVAHGKDFSTGAFSVQAIQPTAVDHARIAASNMVNHGSVRHQGSVLMNVLDTMGLISASYGQWEGVEGGDTAQLLDEENFRYVQLQFEGNRLVGANTLGMTQHIGVLRGLIQGRFDLGLWKQRLMDNPLRVMDAYLAVTQG
ncbi:MAG: NAD(P)/FAD-dependent oxidoreductase [Gammaproteobacteria bacterium]|nr:NAD(P)/FAD-dependent oxidoreductase [Gammaproteobacteria bacterium]